MLCLRRHVQCRGFSCTLGRRRRPELSFRTYLPSAKQSVWALQELWLPSISDDFWNRSELELECSRSSLEQLDVSSVWISRIGGVTGAGVKSFLRLPRRGAFRTQSHGTPEISSKNDVSARYVGSSLRIVIATVKPLFFPTMCSGFFSDVPQQILALHAVPCLESRYRRQSTMFRCKAAPGAFLVTQKPEYPTIHVHTAELGVTPVL